MQWMQLNSDKWWWGRVDAVNTVDSGNLLSEFTQ